MSTKKLAAILGMATALSDYGQYNEGIKQILNEDFAYPSKKRNYSKLPLTNKQKKARAAAKRAKKARRINWK